MGSRNIYSVIKTPQESISNSSVSSVNRNWGSCNPQPQQQQQAVCPDSYLRTTGEEILREIQLATRTTKKNQPLSQREYSCFLRNYLLTHSINETSGKPSEPPLRRSTDSNPAPPTLKAEEGTTAVVEDLPLPISKRLYKVTFGLRDYWVKVNARNPICHSIMLSYGLPEFGLPENLFAYANPKSQGMIPTTTNNYSIQNMVIEDGSYSSNVYFPDFNQQMKRSSMRVTFRNTSYENPFAFSEIPIGTVLDSKPTYGIRRLQGHSTIQLKSGTCIGILNYCVQLDTLTEAPFVGLTFPIQVTVAETVPRVSLDPPPADLASPVEVETDENGQSTEKTIIVVTGTSSADEDAEGQKPKGSIVETDLVALVKTNSLHLADIRKSLGIVTNDVKKLSGGEELMASPAEVEGKRLSALPPLTTVNRKSSSATVEGQKVSDNVGEKETKTKSKVEDEKKSTSDTKDVTKPTLKSKGKPQPAAGASKAETKKPKPADTKPADAKPADAQKEEAKVAENSKDDEIIVISAVKEDNNNKKLSDPKTEILATLADGNNEIPVTPESKDDSKLQTGTKGEPRRTSKGKGENKPETDKRRKSVAKRKSAFIAKGSSKTSVDVKAPRGEPSRKSLHFKAKIETASAVGSDIKEEKLKDEPPRKSSTPTAAIEEITDAEQPEVITEEIPLPEIENPILKKISDLTENVTIFKTSVVTAGTKLADNLMKFGQLQLQIETLKQEIAEVKNKV